MKTAREWVDWAKRARGFSTECPDYGYETWQGIIRQAQQEAYKQGAEDMRAAAAKSCLIEKTRSVGQSYSMAGILEDVISVLPIPAMPEGVDA